MSWVLKLLGSEEVVSTRRYGGRYVVEVGVVFEKVAVTFTFAGVIFFVFFYVCMYLGKLYVCLFYFMIIIVGCEVCIDKNCVFFLKGILE